MKKIKQFLKNHLSKSQRDILVTWYVRAKRLGPLLTHLGLSKQCPECGWRLNSFLPAGSAHGVDSTYIGGGYIEQGSCPHCYAYCRERAVYVFLDSIGAFKDAVPRYSILHIAPDRGLHKRLLRSPRTAHYTSGDIDLVNSIATEVMDIRKIEKLDNSYDIILCNHVLEHIIEDEMAMRELYRVLKPGGYAILQVPISRVLEKTLEDPSITSEEDRIRVFGQRDHVRIYAQKDYVSRLTHAGFRMEIYTNQERWKEEADYWGLIPEEVMYIGRKGTPHA